METGKLQKEAKEKLLDLTGEAPFALLTVRSRNYLKQNSETTVEITNVIKLCL